MATVSGVVQAATDLNAQNLVFSDKNSQTEQLLGNETKDDDSTDSSSSPASITPKDFYWDQIMFYLVSAILGLSFLDISVEFFRGSVVQCFTPPDLTRDQIAYLNNYCYGSLPDSQYYLIFILISALLMIAPHYLWNSYFGRHFDFFFDLVKKLDRLRDSNTGEYKPFNFELVKKLENKFSKLNTWIYRLYMLKLLTQVLISTTVLLANAFYFHDADFEETYLCPESTDFINSTQWPLDSKVICVYNSLNLLKFLRWAAFVLISLSIIFLFIGLMWGLIRHPNELGAKEIAIFSNLSCLPPEEHNFPSMRSVLLNIFRCKKRENLPSRAETCDEDDEQRPRRCGSGICEAIGQLFHPAITSDLDFLLMKLYFADSGHGQVFKDIQIFKEIQQSLSKDQELLYLLKRVQADRYEELIDRFEQYGVITSEEENDSDDELNDMKVFLFKAGLEKAGPGRNPELEVYKKFQHLMGVDIGDWSHSMLRSVIYGFVDNAPKNSLAIDVSFGTATGYSMVLARAFDHVATFHFNNFFRNPKESFKHMTYQAGCTAITYQEDIFSQETKKIVKCEQPLIKMFKETPNGRSIDLIVIGPINDRSKIATANLLIEKLYGRRKYLKKNSILIAIRPLKIGSKTRTDYFVQYKPPQNIFEDINHQIEEKLAANHINTYSVSPLGDVKLIVPSTDRPQISKQVAASSDLQSLSRARRRNSGWSHSRRPSKTVMRLKSLIEQPQVDEFPHGIVVQCNDLECIFEFKIYRYKGRYHAQEDTPSNDTSTNPSCPASEHDEEDNMDVENNNSQQNDCIPSSMPLSPNMPSDLQPPLEPAVQIWSNEESSKESLSGNQLCSNARSSPTLNDLEPSDNENENKLVL